MSRYDCDVAVIGAGFAGAAAACALTKAGLTAIVLEARDRVGGRAFSRHFPGDGELLEFGGSWITPWQARIRHHAAENGIALRPRHEVVEQRHHDGRTLRTGEAASADAMAGFRSALKTIEADAAAYDRGDRSKAPLTLTQYLDSIGASPAARAHVHAWWTISGNGNHDRVSAAEFISSCAYGSGRPEGMIDKLRHTLVPGASALVDRMIARSGARLALNAAVERLKQEAEGVSIMAKGGRRFRARYAVCCLPLNALGAVSFDPPLPPRKGAALRIGHLGSSVKLWIRAAGVTPGMLATGGGSGLQWMFCERATADDGAALIVAFGFRDRSFDPGRRDDVAHDLARFFPEAKLLAWDWHDWVEDPWACGTWVALPADALWIADSALWSPEGRIAFTTSDIAAESAGWFEAAIASGEAAAEVILHQHASAASLP